MLLRIDGYIDDIRQLQGKHMLGILCDAGCELVAPGGMDRITVNDAAVSQVRIRCETGLLAYFPLRSTHRRLAGIEAAGDGLPIARRLAAPELQHLPPRRIDDYQHRFRSLVEAHGLDIGSAGMRFMDEPHIFRHAWKMEPGKTTLLPGELKKPGTALSAYVQEVFDSVGGSRRRMCSSLSWSSPAAAGASVS